MDAFTSFQHPLKLPGQEPKNLFSSTGTLQIVTQLGETVMMGKLHHLSREGQIQAAIISACCISAVLETFFTMLCVELQNREASAPTSILDTTDSRSLSYRRGRNKTNILRVKQGWPCAPEPPLPHSSVAVIFTVPLEVVPLCSGTLFLMSGVVSAFGFHLVLHGEVKSITSKVSSLAVLLRAFRNRLRRSNSHFPRDTGKGMGACFYEGRFRVLGLQILPS